MSSSVTICVYFSCFHFIPSGTLAPCSQSSVSHPRRGITIILQILNDLLKAACHHHHHQGASPALSSLHCPASNPVVSQTPTAEQRSKAQCEALNKTPGELGWKCDSLEVTEHCLYPSYILACFGFIYFLLLLQVSQVTPYIHPHQRIRHCTVSWSACSFWCIRGVFRGGVAGTHTSHRGLIHTSICTSVPSWLDSKDPITVIAAVAAFKSAMPPRGPIMESWHLTFWNGWKSSQSVCCAATFPLWAFLKNVSAEQSNTKDWLRQSLNWACNFMAHNDSHCNVALSQEVQTYVMLYILVLCKKFSCCMFVCCFVYCNALM